LATAVGKADGEKAASTTHLRLLLNSISGLAEAMREGGTSAGNIHANVVVADIG
jgi:hypothetical protein